MNARTGRSGSCEKRKLRILAIETSCDETAAAVENGRRALPTRFLPKSPSMRNTAAVPEIASRNHLESCPILWIRPCARRAAPLEKSTRWLSPRTGAGGGAPERSFMPRALAFSLNKPLIAVNHMEGHIFGQLYHLSGAGAALPLPVVVSGGHTNIVKVEDYGRYVPWGATRTTRRARRLTRWGGFGGLCPIPAGRICKKLAEQGNRMPIISPRASGEHHLIFPFSGLENRGNQPGSPHGAARGRL